MTRKVLLVQAIHPAGLDVLVARPDIEVVRPASPAAADLRAVLPDCEAVLLRASPFGADLQASAPGLRIVSRHGVGLDNVPLAACAERGIAVTHVGDVNSVPVAEHTLALILAIAKQIVPYDAAVRQGSYGIRESFAPRELQAKTLLLLGLGRIGREVARLAGAFRMRCLAYDPGLPADAIRAAGCEPVEDWHQALPDADVLTLHLPLSPGTRGLIGAAELGALRPHAIVVNCARGGLIDEAALDAALASGGLLGAGLDVTEAEPPPADHPLLRNGRTVLSPHSAALTQECAMRMAMRSAQNIVDFFDGRLDPGFVAVAAPARAG